MNRRGPTALVLLMVIALLVLLWPLEGSIEGRLSQLRPKRAEVQLPGELPGIYRFFQLAGLNALLADILWMKADDLWHSASWWEMAPVMESIVRIDPRFVLVWRVLCWHYGWNLHVASRTAVERAFWLQKAGDAYARAVEENPEDYDLWWDMCWFYTDRIRQWDKAAHYLELGVKKFPDEIDTIERSLQRVYEKTWRVEDAVRVIKDILRKRPTDGIARRDLAWWTKWDKDINWRWVLEYREHLYRERRDLPWFRNPFEGTLVPSPPWRKWEAPNYMDPDWKPDLTRFGLQSVSTVLERRPDLRQEWLKAHPELKPQPGPPPGGRFPMGRPPGMGRMPGPMMRPGMMQPPEAHRH